MAVGIVPNTWNQFAGRVHFTRRRRMGRSASGPFGLARIIAVRSKNDFGPVGGTQFFLLQPFCLCDLSAVGMARLVSSRLRRVNFIFQKARKMFLVQRNRSFVLLFACVVSISTRAEAAEFDQDKLDLLRVAMQKYVDNKTVAGASVAIGSREGIVAAEALGSLNLEQKLPMPVDALFRIASMTKPVTAMAIMMLVDDGKLSVDDAVEKHLSEFKGQMIFDSKAGEKITLRKPTRPIQIRDLLTHTSGLPGGFPEGISDLYFRRHLTLGEAVAISSQRPLDFEPGTKWSYCNAGIDTLGRIVEVVSEKSFEEFLEQRIFFPLGMFDTTFYPNDEQLQRLAALYELKDGELRDRISVNRPNKDGEASHSRWRVVFDAARSWAPLSADADGWSDRRIASAVNEKR